MDRRNWLRCLTALSLAGFSTAGWAQKDRERSRESGRSSKKLENPACRGRGRGRERGTAQAPRTPNGRSDCRPRPTTCCATKAPSEPGRARWTEKSARGVRLRGLQPAAFHFGDEIRQRQPDGRVFSPRYPGYSGPRPTASSSWSAPNTTACAAVDHHGHIFDDGPEPTGPALLQQRRGAAIHTQRGRHRNPPERRHERERP